MKKLIIIIFLLSLWSCDDPSALIKNKYKITYSATSTTNVPATVIFTDSYGIEIEQDFTKKFDTTLNDKVDAQFFVRFYIRNNDTTGAVSAELLFNNKSVQKSKESGYINICGRVQKLKRLIQK